MLGPRAIAQPICEELPNGHWSELAVKEAKFFGEVVTAASGGAVLTPETALRAAFKIDPQSATAAYNLGVVLAAERPDEALDWCRKAHALEPQEPKFTYTLAFYLHAKGARDEAVTLLRTVTDRRAGYLDAYVLLGQIYEEGRQKNDAVELYRQAAAAEQFPAEVRQQFSTRAQWLSQRR